MRSSLCLLAASVFVFGCNAAKLTAAPDAAPNCAAPVLEYPCAAQPPGTPGCSSELDAALFERTVTLDGSFPPGCTVIVNDPVADVQNACIQLGTCRCDGVGDGGTFGWACRK